jgi:hypothetical protein
VRKKEETREKKRERSRGSPFFLFFPFPRTISGSLVQFRQKPKTAVEIASLASKLTREKIVRIFK